MLFLFTPVYFPVLTPWEEETVLVFHSEIWEQGFQTNWKPVPAAWGAMGSRISPWRGSQPQGKRHNSRTLCHLASPLQSHFHKKVQLLGQAAWVPPLCGHHGALWVIWRTAILLVRRVVSGGWHIKLFPRGARAIKIDSIPRNRANYSEQPLHQRRRQPGCSQPSSPCSAFSS